MASKAATTGGTPSPGCSAAVRVPPGSGAIGAILATASATIEFWAVLVQYIYYKREYPASDALLSTQSPSTLFTAASILAPAWLKRSNSPHSNAPFGGDVWANVQVFSLSLIFKMWSRAPHYRSRDFQEDMINNLKNVAIPGEWYENIQYCLIFSDCMPHWISLFYGNCCRYWRPVECVLLFLLHRAGLCFVDKSARLCTWGCK
jgi:hypothetical protein